MPDISGTPGDDTLNGTAADESIYGYEGNDTINGGDGADSLLGWSGNDTLNGDAGNDTLYGMDGDDTLNGGSGNDYIVGSLGRDTMSGGDGDDTFQLNNGDIVAGETIDGGAGNDTVTVPRDVYSSAPLDITGVTFTGVETLRGDQGYFIQATVAQLSSVSNLDGWFLFTTTDPILLSGVSATGLFQLANGGATFDATGSTTPPGGFLAIYGGDGADTITGSGGQDLLDGGAGNDILYGGDGNDTFRGRGGVDQMYGGAGDDYFEFSSTELVAGEILDGGSGFDAVYLYWEVYDLSGFAFTNIEGIAKAGVHAPDVYLTAAQFNGLTSIDARLYITTAQPISLAGKSFADGSVVNLSSADNTVTMAGIVSGNPQIVGSTGNDSITGSGLADTLSGGGGNDTLIGGDGNDVLKSGTGVDNLDGGAGDDRLIIEDTDLAGDQYVGGDGIDTLVVGSLDISGLALTGIERIEGSNVSMTAAQLNGLSGLDVFSVTLTTGGAVTLSGAGPYYLTLSAAGNSIDFSGVTGPANSTGIYGGAGADSIIGRNLADYTDYLAGNGGDDVLDGRAGGDNLSGGDGNDILIGGLGNDLMSGDLGDDTYYVDSALDYVTEGLGSGSNDRVFASVSYALQSDAEVERLATIDVGDTNGIDLTGSGYANIIDGNAGSNTLHGMAGNDTLSGSGGNDALHGEDGDDSLDGGLGADAMAGGFGNDIYWVNDLGDSVSEASNQGSDRVLTSIGYALAAGQHVEFLSTTSDAGTGAIDLTGNELAQTITGNAGVNVLIGLDGNDVLNGLGGNDTMTGGLGDDTYYVESAGDVVNELAGQGTDTIAAAFSYALADGSAVENLATIDAAATTAINLTGNAGVNALTGNAGSNMLDGGAGSDSLAGGGGDDLYFVDNAGDQVIEGVAAGYDTVFSTVSFTLGANVDRLFAYDPSSSAGLNFTGNALPNEIAGTAGANVIDGGAGADFMNGQGGNDIYFVDNAGDYVFETAGNGFDTVFATFSYTLASDVERVFALDPAGTAALNFTGNALDNELGGTAGANILDGGAGADLMVGADGDDIYFVDNAGDVVSDSPTGGYDTVFASISFVLETRIERVVALDPNSTAALSFTGNAVANEITGNAGSNLINGGGGADILFGGAGGDAFVFTSALGGDNVAALPDFAVGQDRIYLDDAVFSALTAGALSAGAFHTGAAAADADDRIVYDSVTGALYYDADGNGAGLAVQFASLHEGLALSAGDFQIV